MQLFLVQIQDKNAPFDCAAFLISEQASWTEARPSLASRSRRTRRFAQGACCSYCSWKAKNRWASMGRNVKDSSRISARMFTQPAGAGGWSA